MTKHKDGWIVVVDNGFTYYIPDYSKPGVKEAITAEVDEICDNALPKDY